MTITDLIQANSVWIAFGLIALVLLYYIIVAIEAFRKRTATFVLLFGLLFITWLAFNIWNIEPADQVQIMLLLALLAVTGIYANANVKMAEEMRNQRRPIVVQQVATGRDADGIQVNVSPPSVQLDYFEIRNVGNSPAIELQIVLLDKKKSRLQIQKQVILSQADTPLEFHPADLANREETTCYLVCQYRSVLSPNVRQTWYETWLPFELIKSPSKDKISIRPGELEFREEFEKKSY